MKAIVIGYQGIGKSTLASKHISYIDLESSCMTDDVGFRPEHWEQLYGRTAIHLALQNHCVFVSSHSIVQDYLTATAKLFDVPVLICYPDASLKHAWLEKLEARYKKCPTLKNKKAYLNALDGFDDQIAVLEKCPGIKVKLTDVNYDLDNLILDALEIRLR